MHFKHIHSLRAHPRPTGSGKAKVCAGFKESHPDSAVQPGTLEALRMILIKLGLVDQGLLHRCINDLPETLVKEQILIQ